MRAFIVVVLLLIAADPRRPVSIWLAGDSTMAEKVASKRPETGWGEMLGQYFREDAVRVANRAVNGRSTRSFVSEGRWSNIVDSLAPGDYVFVQFGHNDESKDKGDRYSPPEEFARNLARMVDDVRAKRAIPVLFTPVVRRKFDEAGSLIDTHGEYPQLTRRVAREKGVALIDMERLSAGVVASLGTDSSAKLFLQLEAGESANYPEGVRDNTHFRPLGAELMARAAVDEVRRLGLNLARHLKGGVRR